MVIDLVLRRSLIDIKWPRAESYVLETAIFPAVPPIYSAVLRSEGRDGTGLKWAHRAVWRGEWPRQPQLKTPRYRRVPRPSVLGIFEW